MQIFIVSAEQEIYSGQAAMVFAPALMGEVGIAPGHTAFLSLLRPGEVRVQEAESEERSFYISGGIIEVQPGAVTVLSDTAVRAEDLDEAAVLKAKQAAEREFHERGSKIDYAAAQAHLAEAAAQLHAIQRLRRRTGRS